MTKQKPTDLDPVSRRISILFYEERVARRLSQVELAKKLKMSQPHLSKIDNGLATPTLLNWIRFTELFSVPSDIVTNEAAFEAHLTQLRKQAIKRPWSDR